MSRKEETRRNAMQMLMNVFVADGRRCREGNTEKRQAVLVIYTKMFEPQKYETIMSAFREVFI